MACHILFTREHCDISMAELRLGLLVGHCLFVTDSERQTERDFPIRPPVSSACQCNFWGLSHHGCLHPNLQQASKFARNRK